MLVLKSAFRNLHSIIFVAFTACASSSPALAGADCNANPADPAPYAQEFRARVIGLASQSQISSGTKAVEIKTGWLVSTEYLTWPRVIAEVDQGQGRVFTSLAAHPADFHPKIGDRVVVISRHRDPATACHFIPWTVKSPDAVSDSKMGAGDRSHRLVFAD